MPSFAPQSSRRWAFSIDRAHPGAQEAALQIGNIGCAMDRCSGRFTHPDDRLLFLAMDNASINISGLDLDTLFRKRSGGISRASRTDAHGAGYPWSREAYSLISERY